METLGPWRVTGEQDHRGAPQSLLKQGSLSREGVWSWRQALPSCDLGVILAVCLLGAWAQPAARVILTMVQSTGQLGASCAGGWELAGLMTAGW